MLQGKQFILTAVAVVVLFTLSQSGCSTPPPPKPLSISEQIEVDTRQAAEFIKEFQKQAIFHAYPAGERYLTHLAQAIAQSESGFDLSSLKVRITEDANPQLSQLFSFPGTTLFVPYSLLNKIEYENELAAILAYELANVFKRHLARKMDVTANPALFGTESVFHLDRDARAESIRLATRLMYFAGYDTRGMASVFQRYPSYFAPNQGTELAKKEVEFNVREAQMAKSEYLPSRGPIVRSAEFINMKKGLKEPNRKGIN